MSSEDIYLPYENCKVIGVKEFKRPTTLVPPEYIRAPESFPANIFTDVLRMSKYGEFVAYLKELNVVAGYSDGSYHPERNINRAEFTKILVRFFFPNEVGNFSSQNCFKDIFKDQWFSRDVCFAQQKGIVQGYEDGYFKPDQNINTVEALKVALEAYGAELPYIPNAPWYEKYINYAKGNNLNKIHIWLDDWGDEVKLLTRGEMAEIIVRTDAAALFGYE